MQGVVTAVSRKAGHGIGKENQPIIRLLAGLGVEGDAHAGATMQHLSRNAGKPNLRQVHLIHGELHDELRDAGFDVAPGRMGENVTTRGLALLDLPTGTKLRLGQGALIEITGLRTPCSQLDGIQPGLFGATFPKDAAGRPIRKAGIMAIVLAPGEIKPGDAIAVELPPEPHRPLEPV